MSHNTNTENRKKNPLKGIREGLKKALVYFMCVSMLMSNMSTSIAYAATRVSADEDESEIYSMDIESILEAVAVAAENGEPVGEDEYEFSGSAAYKYNRILNTDDGLLYEIFPDPDEEGSIELRTFVRLSEDPVDDSYNVTGDEDIIFLFINDGTDDVEARIHIFNEDDVYETKVINIPAMFGSVTLVNADDDDEEVVEVALKAADEENDKEESSADDKETGEENTEDEDEPSGSVLEFVTIDTKQSNIETAALRVESSDDAGREFGPGVDPEEDEADTVGEEDNETAEEPGETDEGTLKRAASTSVSASIAPSASSSTVAVETFVETPSNVIIGTTYTEGTKALAGTIYEAVGLSDASAVAFTTTFDKMGYEAETVTYEAEDGGITVTVTASKEALPEGAKLVVERYDEESEDYEAAALAIKYEETVTEFSLLHATDIEEETDKDEADEAAEPEINMAALDIHFETDGEEIEPDGTVKVSIDISELIPEDAVLDSLEVQHLVEEGNDIENIIVADETAKTDGTVDLEAGVVEFEVDSFSTFTVTWEWKEQSGTTSSVSITVTAYLDGQELDGLDNIEFDSQDDELNLETMLNEEHFGTSDYTFSWAYFTYERTTGPSTQTTTIGTEDDPVVAIEKAAGGQSSLYVIQLSGTSNTVQSGNNMHLYVYYLSPTFSVEITPVAEDEAEDWLLQATLSHAGDYESVGYVWSITDTSGNETTLATVDWDDETGRAFIVWSEDIQNFDEVVVHVKVTLDGDETKTAEASYTLEYGDEYVNIQMTYGPDFIAVGADVEVTLTNTVTGKTYTRTTDAIGQILSLEIEPGIYTVTAEATINGERYVCDATATVTIADSGNYSINMNYADVDRTTAGLDADYKTDWNHIDIKLATGTTGSGVSSEGVTVNIIGAVITDSSDNIKYTADSTSIQAGASDNEWQIYFYTGTDTTGSYSHTIEFATTDSITIIYTLEWEESEAPETYTVTIDYDSTYPEGTLYPANGQRAYKLYNYLYGTNYSSNAQLMAAGVENIDIGNTSMMLVAGILCDSSTTGTAAGGAGKVTGTDGMWGMDFALSVEGFVSLSTAWMFDVEKTYENHAMTADMFTFTLNDATVDETGIWTEEEGVGSGWEYTWSNSTAGKGIDGNSSDTMLGIYIPYDDDEIQKGVTYYYILSESAGDAVYTKYDGTVFGAKVEVYVDNDGTSQTYGEAVIEVTYYTLTKNSEDPDTYTATEYTGEKITFGDNNYPTFHFTNIYTTDVNITKTDPYGNNLNAQFTLTQVVTDPDTEDTRNCYYAPDNANSPWIDYEYGEVISSFTLGSIDLKTPYDGTYTLTEIGAADGYGTLPGAIEFEVVDGIVVENSVKWADSSIKKDIFDYATLTSGFMLTIKDPDTTTQVTVNKEWKDNNSEDRPTSVTVQLYAGDTVYGDAVTLDSSNSWTYTWEELPVHNFYGKETEYTVTEAEVDGYTESVSELKSVTDDNGNVTGYTVTITNTRSGETEISVEKKWIDNDNAYKIRPDSITVTITGSDGNTYTLTLNEGNSWSDTQSNLPLYTEEGVEITYTVTEKTVNGYTGDVVSNEDGNYTITNTLETVDLSGTKTWEDQDNKYELRPSEITILIMNGENIVTTTTATATDNWTWSVSGLPKCDSDGNDIIYTITEVTVPGYKSEVNGYNITNTLETIDINGTKTWDDADNQDGKRVTEITVNLLSNGEKIDSTTVTGAATANSWSWSFTGLPKYDSYGAEITYSVTEDTVEDYTTEITGSSSEGFEIVNSYEPGKVSLNVEKVWNDSGDSDGERPTEITVKLLKNTSETGDELTLNESTNWKGTFENLDEYTAGIKNEYSVAEVEVDDYVSMVTNEEGTTSFVITNTHESLLVTLTGTKVWVDNGEDDSRRPESIIISLYRYTDEDMTEFELVDSIEVTPDADGNWTWTFENLPKFHNHGDQYIYYLTETDVNGYESVIGDVNEETDYYTDVITNIVLSDLSLTKEVSGTSDTNEYEFEIALTTPEGYPMEGDVTVTYSDSTEDGKLVFENGTANINLKAGVTATLKDLPYSTEADITETITGKVSSVTAYVGDEAVVSVKGTETKAMAEVGTIADSTQVVFVNSYRAYFPIDEEIVTDTDDIFDRDAWVKDEAVNEYNAIEIEMTTNLPVVTVYDLANGEFSMNFHEVLDHELVLDEDTADFSVYIAETPISTAYYRITFDDDTGDDCNFHVDVDLTALYNDGIVTEDMLDGNTEITIFFFADLEGTGLNGSYTSTIWYDIYDGDEWLYTADPSVVEVYTYEIKLTKYDSSTLEGEDYAASALSGATFGIFYDESASNAVSRNGEDYTTVSDEDGMAIFYGLADGTYYVKELEAPYGYVLKEDTITVELGQNSTDGNHVYSDNVGNEPKPEPDPEPIPEPDGGDGGNGGSGGGGGYSGSGSGHSNSSTSGPGAESTAHESSGGGSSSDHSGVNTDNIGGLPATGEGNTMMILMGVCIALAAVLAVLFYMRRKTPKDQA